MEPDVAGQPNSKYACVERGCTFCWHWEMGYFFWKSGEIELPPKAHTLMKPALMREHGYLYIESVSEGTKTWKCPIQDCLDTLVEES